ncbi:MAG: helix-turn-helix domain-containing protein [Candidatus Bathyarchaeia archaeon]
MSSSSLWQKLREYVNLSEYEAKVFSSLIKEGSATARRLSMLCNVPRTKIYKTLKKLIEQGLVTEASTEPVKFVPLPPSDTFKSFLNLYEGKNEESL